MCSDLNPDLNPDLLTEPHPASLRHLNQIITHACMDLRALQIFVGTITATGTAMVSNGWPITYA